MYIAMFIIAILALGAFARTKLRAKKIEEDAVLSKVLEYHLAQMHNSLNYDQLQVIKEPLRELQRVAGEAKPVYIVIGREHPNFAKVYAKGGYRYTETS